MYIGPAQYQEVPQVFVEEIKKLYEILRENIGKLLVKLLPTCLSWKIIQNNMEEENLMLIKIYYLCFIEFLVWFLV